MADNVRVHFLPSLLDPDELPGTTAIVIDILRASTTIVEALAQGAECVVPHSSVEDALQWAQQAGRDSVLLGGERGGVLIEGFDLGNSPASYTFEVVGAKTIGFTTTNGTRALLAASRAEHVFVGAFSNIHAVAAVASTIGLPVNLVCAGTNGEISAEDVLFAGTLARCLRPQGAEFANHDDAREVAEIFSALNCQDATAFDSALRDSLGGRNLTRLKYDDDISLAGRWDRHSLVPVYDHESGRIVPFDSVPSEISHRLAVPAEVEPV